MAVAVVAVAVVIALGAVTRAGTTISRQIGSMVNASMEIRVEIGLFHLWFEKMLQGDPSIKSGDVWQRLANTEWYFCNRSIE